MRTAPSPCDRHFLAPFSGKQHGGVPKRGLTFSLAVAIGTFVSGFCYAQNNSVIELDPVGRPGMHVSSNAPGTYIWWEGGTWHVRHRTVAKGHEIQGRIEIVGGKVAKVFNFQSMEVGRRKDVRDGGLVNPARDTIAFRFRTKGHEDGFDFTVTKNASELAFHLQVDGKEMPRRIHVGKGGVNPSGAGFRLPAHPAAN